MLGGVESQSRAGDSSSLGPWHWSRYLQILGSLLHAPGMALQGSLALLCGHPMHHGLQLGTVPVSTTPSSLGPSACPPMQPVPLTIWTLSAGRAVSNPSPRQPLCRAGGRTPGLLLLVEKLALGLGAAWGMGRTVAVGAAGAGVLGGGSRRGAGCGAGSSGLGASWRKRW